MFEFYHGLQSQTPACIFADQLADPVDEMYCKYGNKCKGEGGLIGWNNTWLV